LGRSLVLLALLSLGACADASREEPSGQDEVMSERSASGENSPPVIQSIQVLPQPPYRNTVLHADASATDPDRDRVRYSYQWEKNGFPIEGATDSTLLGSFLKKGDKVAVTVTPDDGRDAGEPATSEVLTVQNSPPLVTFVAVSPNPAHKKGKLTAVAEAQDLDGDSIDYSYQWLKNGQQIEDETAESLEPARFAKGDVIAVEVTPTDGQSEGGPVVSSAVTVENSPPRFTSTPSPSLSDEDVYVYQVSAEDPDGDPVQYSLTSAPDGMAIDSRSGVIQWSVTQKEAGTHSIEIVAADDDGAQAVQRYDLRIFDLQKQGGPPPS
jgi:hypothetical protein